MTNKIKEKPNMCIWIKRVARERVGPFRTKGVIYMWSQAMWARF